LIAQGKQGVAGQTCNSNATQWNWSDREIPSRRLLRTQLISMQFVTVSRPSRIELRRALWRSMPQFCRQLWLC